MQTWQNNLNYDRITIQYNPLSNYFFSISIIKQWILFIINMSFLICLKKKNPKKPKVMYRKCVQSIWILSIRNRSEFLNKFKHLHGIIWYMKTREAHDFIFIIDRIFSWSKWVKTVCQKFLDETWCAILYVWFFLLLFSCLLLFETKNCLYSIPCSFGKVYKGETSHPLKVRQEEHQKAVVQGEIERPHIERKGKPSTLVG